MKRRKWLNRSTPLAYRSEKEKARRIEWAKVRDECFERDEYACRRCEKEGRKGNVLDAHHLLSVRRGGKDDLDNLVTLCRSCHESIHYHLAPDWERWLLSAKGGGE